MEGENQPEDGVRLVVVVSECCLWNDLQQLE